MPPQTNDPAREWESAQTAASFDLSAVGAIQFAGPDAAKFLQGQLTNEIANLDVGQGCWTALCTPKGRIVSDLFLFRLPDRFLGLLQPERTEIVAEDLEKRHFSEDLNIQPVTDSWSAIGLEGARIPEILQGTGLELPQPGSYGFVPTELAGQPALVMGASWTSGTGTMIATPTGSRSAIGNWLEEQGVQPAGADLFRAMRIASGRPVYGADMDEGILLPETGHSEVMVSYTKGCYLGQEAIARMRTYGSAVKLLRGLKIEGDALPSSGEMTADGKKAGLLKSVAHHPTLGILALAYLRKEVNETGKRFEFTLEGSQTVYAATPYEFPLG